MAMWSELDYRCGYCGLRIEGGFNEVLKAIRLHEDDWNKVINEVVAGGKVVMDP